MKPSWKLWGMFEQQMREHGRPYHHILDKQCWRHSHRTKVFTVYVLSCVVKLFKLFKLLFKLFKLLFKLLLLLLCKFTRGLTPLWSLNGLLIPTELSLNF